MPELNPFTQIFNTLWDLIDSSVPLTDLVKVRNKIKFNKAFDRDPIKLNIQVSDLPELILMTDGSPGANLHFSSCGSMCFRGYAWVISTGDNRVTEFLNDLEFGIFSAMVDAPDLLYTLTWKGQRFVTDVNMDALTEGLLEQEQNRGIQGWSSIWGMTIRLNIPTQSLKDYHNGE